MIADEKENRCMYSEDDLNQINLFPRWFLKILPRFCQIAWKGKFFYIYTAHLNILKLHYKRIESGGRRTLKFMKLCCSPGHGASLVTHSPRWNILVNMDKLWDGYTHTFYCEMLFPTREPKKLEYFFTEKPKADSVLSASHKTSWYTAPFPGLLATMV